MRIMTQQSYDAICDIVMEQKKRLEEKEKEIERLNKQISFLENLINMKVDVTIHEENKRLKRDLEDLQKFCMNFASDHKELDFPNSDHKTYNGYVDKFI